MARTSIDNRLAQVRKARGIAAATLARAVNVSRQTIYAIEAGSYVPNTEVALQLARELEVTVDELFALSNNGRYAPETRNACILSATAPLKGQPVRLCRIDSLWAGVPVPSIPYFMPQSEGIIDRRSRKSGHAEIIVFAPDEAEPNRLLLAGCDPATSLLTDMVERTTGVEIVAAAASSKLALTWLKEGKVHIAGSHLEHSKSGEFNTPYVREMFPDDEMTVVTFATWEEGFVVARGNPKSIRTADDLTGKNITAINREPGAGSRALLDKLLRKSGIPAARIRGYNEVVYGHLPAAYRVLSGQADVCIATRSAARAFNLDFVPLHAARYDFVMRKRTAGLHSVRGFLDVLQRESLRRKLEMLAGYDTTKTGTVV